MPRPSATMLSVVINVGTGTGVRGLVTAFQNVLGGELPINKARPRGDAVGAFANVDESARLPGWRTPLSLEDAIASALG